MNVFDVIDAALSAFKHQYHCSPKTIYVGRAFRIAMDLHALEGRSVTIMMRAKADPSETTYRGIPLWIRDEGFSIDLVLE